MSQTFRDYMHAALYGKTGYYSSGKVEFGIRGDYYTTGQVHELFAELIAERFVQLWVEDGSPANYVVAELGPGDGTFAHSTLSSLKSNHREAFDSMKYVCSEISPALVARQKEKLREFTGKVEWVDGAPSGESGIIFSNEFFDALPVHVVQQVNGQLKELYVEDGRWVAGEVSASKISDVWLRCGAALKEGQRAEICLEAIRVLEVLSRNFQHAHMITIDYGDFAEGLYTEDRFDGTLRSFKNHKMTRDAFLWRDCDITASVNFTLISEYGRDSGFQPRTFAGLPQYLMKMGVLERVARMMSESEAANPRELQQRLAAKQLFTPQGIAASFKVLETCKKS